MTPPLRLLPLLLLLALAVPGVVGENVTRFEIDPSAFTPQITYPQEYYTLGNMADGYSRDYDQNGWNTIDERNGFAIMAVFKELRRQTILMEKQNEMIYQQNMWQRNATLKCINPGNYQCKEYAWVGGA